MKHAFLSPSGAPAWLRCHAKVWREKGLPDDSSKFADEGTAAHLLRDACLQFGYDAKTLLDSTIIITPEGAKWLCDCSEVDTEVGRYFYVDQTMCMEVQKSINVLRAFGGRLYPEQKLNTSFITGEENATGTADAIILRGSELIVDDLKYGMGVLVEAVDNEQLLIYGAAALEEFDITGDIKTVHLRISMPRLNHDSAWVLSADEVRQRVVEIRKVADTVLKGENLLAVPGDKQCRFCKAKATCPEYRAHTLGTVLFTPIVDLKKGEIALSMQDAERVIAQAYGVKVKDVTFDIDLSMQVEPCFILKKPTIIPQVGEAIERIAEESDEQLATVMDAADMIDGFVKAVRAEIERRLFSGQFSDARYKLVEGKKGHRAWVDAEEAEKVLKAMRLKVNEMYDLKLISPTSAEKVLAEANPRKWAKLKEHITQGQGKPSVAPASDKRPALSMQVGFAVVPEEVIEANPHTAITNEVAIEADFDDLI